MPKINEIQTKLLEIDGTKFHKLGDAYLNKRYGYKIQSIGTKNGEDKPTTGNPDTLIILENGQYVFVEYTTQETGIRDKFIADIKKCLDVSSTGIEIKKIDKIILACNRKLSSTDIEALKEECHPINCDVITNSSLSNDMYNHTPRIVNEYLGIKINETIHEKLPHDINDKLKNSIEREIDNEVFSAIDLRENEIIILQGEEGVGKTILSLQIARKLSKDKHIIRFFKSHEWEQYNNIKDLLFNSEENNFEETITEEENIIIFLDGLNERHALQAGNRLLENFHSLSQEAKNKINLVFTTRDLTTYSEYKHSDWKIYKTFEVNKFTENELQTAIKKIDSEYDYKMFPNELKEISSIPRYLTLAFKLKMKFENYKNITKEMLYWEGLKAQIMNDPKIREQGITEDSDIETILYRICKSISVENNKATINSEIFKDYFGDDYRKVKTPFLESRIVIGNDMQKVELNFDMVVIAYSVYLLTLFDNVDTSLSVAEIADFFKLRLEPYDNDYMSAIPFIVFQISLEKNSTFNKDNLSKIYAGLLYLWFDNHNAIIYTENLDFWSKKDFRSYVSILNIVELNYKTFNRPKLKNGMLEVLSDRWSMSRAKDKEIELYLNDTLSTNLDFDINDREKLIRRAIRIIFSYPTKHFLDKFLEIQKALSKINTNESLMCKYNLDKYLSVLFRFGYKEDIFEYLLENRQYDKFSVLFRSYELSEKISIPIDNDNRLSLVEKIKAKEELLKDFTAENVYKFDDLSFLSFRRDLELSNKDKTTIKTTLTNMSNAYMPSRSMGGGRSDNVDIDFLKLLASFDSDAFNRINQAFLYEAISQKARLNDIEKFDLCMFKNNKIVEFIIQNLYSLIDIEDKNERDRYIDKLIEIILFSADEGKMLEFFDLIIDKSCSVCLSEDTAEHMKAISGDKLLSLIKHKIEVYHSENINNPELYENYMTYLFILEDYKNSFLREWILHKTSAIEENKKLNDFHAKVFVTVLPVVQYFDKFSIKELLPNTGNYLTYWITSEDNFLDEKTFEELIELLPIDSVGQLLHKNKKYDDINKWGIALFENNNPMSSMQYLGLKESLEVFSENNKELFLDYAVNYLNQVTDIGILFTGGLKDELIELLMKIDFDKAMELYESDERKSLDSHIMQSLFDLEQYGDSKHIEYRENIILKAKSDLEYMQIVIMAFQGKTDNEVLKICKELIESRYAKDRLKAISMLMWFPTINEIEILNNLKLYDDSDYVRKYAQWAEQVILQEKYTREICEEAFREKNKSVLSAKLYQIRNSLTPTFGYWGGEIIKQCRQSNKTELDRVYIQKFLDRTREQRKIKNEFEVNGRKLSEYCCGEKLDNDFKYILNME